MRLIDADATIKYLREFRCKDCDRRKGMKNGKIRFCYEIGDAPCRACDIGDTIDYFLDEDISPTVDAVPVVRCKDCELKEVCITSRGDEWYCGDARQKIEWGKVKGVPAEYEGDARSLWWYVCPECHGAIDPGEHKCRHCGTVILWE